jgi:L-alanine-DL-glutamate epimerase-like enolase superfamily enzyme
VRTVADAAVVYRDQITVEQIAVIDSHIAVPQGVGLGLDVDEDALRRLDARR